MEASRFLPRIDRSRGNGVGFRDLKEPAGQIRELGLAKNCRIDEVSIGCDPMSRSCSSEVEEVSGNFPVQ
jgi:hypothetical protein